MKCKTFITFLIVLISANILFAQTSDLDIKLAKNYYVDGDYEKAVLYFEKIAKDPSKIVSIYDYYKNALIELNQIKSAEKLCKSIIKQSPDNLSLLVDLGGIYGIDENLTKQNQFFDKAIDKINNQTSFTNVSNLGLSFEKIGDLERAIIVYKKGRENNETNPYAYHNKLAIIYNKLGKTSDMVNIYLELLDQSERYLSAVQNGFSNSIDFDIQLKEKEILRKALIKKVQEFPKKVIYLKLLSWFYLINNDYESAFIQIKALDRKLNKDGEELLSLGLTALNNNDFNIAIMCFDEVLESTHSMERNFKAKNLRLKAIKNKLTSGTQITTKELEELKSNFLQILSQLDQASNSFSITKRKHELLKELADLEAYYLRDVNSAKVHLNNAMNLKGIREKSKAQLKLQLADFLVLENNIWEASLMYIQIEKQFKNDPIGHIAKFKNAQVYYFAGEFDWCQAQLEVLKASTSKLIANDALELSVLITDNYNMDTSEKAMKLFSYGDMLSNQYKFKEALTVYDSVFENFKDHSLSDDILLRKAKVLINMHQYDSAIFQLNLLEKNYPNSILIDNVLFLIATTYEDKLGDLELAKSYYRKILFNYPGSLYVVDARNRFRKLSGNTNTNILKDS